jgi:hypothetical protein
MAKQPFLERYPLSDADLDASLTFAQANMSQLDERARYEARRKGVDHDHDLIEADPRLNDMFNQAWEEIMFHSHLTAIWCERNGRVI